MLVLSDKHRRKLFEESAIREDVAMARGYRTVTDPGELKPRDFTPQQRRGPCLLIPIFAPDGKNGRYQARPDYCCDRTEFDMGVTE